MHLHQECETNRTIVGCSGDAAHKTRTAYAEACALLGYSGPDREADEVIDLLGVTDDGQRFAKLAGFYPAPITIAVDRAAHHARKCPEALLSDGERALLDLLAMRAS